MNKKNKSIKIGKQTVILTHTDKIYQKYGDPWEGLNKSAKALPRAPLKARPPA